MISIGLIRPKYVQNLASTVRAAACYGATHVYYTGDRLDLTSTKEDRTPRELRMKAYDHIGRWNDNYFLNHLPEGTVPVAVELLPGAENLPDFIHPPNACYIFGPEDGDIPPVIRRHCHKFVVLPTEDDMCLNLATTVATVLYDRKAKECRSQ